MKKNVLCAIKLFVLTVTQLCTISSPFLLLFTLKCTYCIGYESSEDIYLSLEVRLPTPSETSPLGRQFTGHREGYNLAWQRDPIIVLKLYKCSLLKLAVRRYGEYLGSDPDKRNPVYEDQRHGWKSYLLTGKVLKRILKTCEVCALSSI